MTIFTRAMSVTNLSVVFQTRCTTLVGRAALLSVLTGLAATEARAAPQDICDGLVRVEVRREFSGLLHENRYIPELRIHKVAEFNGVILDTRGYVVTYVGSYFPELSSSESRLWVTTADGIKHSARLIGVDERVALAVLEAEKMAHQPLECADTSGAKQLQLVLASTRGWGIHPVALVRLENSPLLPELEVQVSGVPSGMTGPSLEGALLLDGTTKFVGIVSRATAYPFSRRLQTLQVLPVEIIRDSMGKILAEKRGIGAGWLGVHFESPERRPRISHVVPGSPAETAGLRSGDVLLGIDGQRVQNFVDAARMIRWKGSGGKLVLNVERQGLRREVPVVLSSRKDAPPLVSWKLEVPRVWRGGEPQTHDIRISRSLLPAPLNLGLVVDALTPQLAEFLQCPSGQGLLVKSVIADSPAHRAGFQAGDVLIQINGRNVTSALDLKQSVEATADGQLLIQFVREGRPQERRIVVQ